METSKGITVDQKALDEFFADIKCGNPRNEKELTDFQKAAIVMAYENGYNKDATSKKLKVSDKRMRAYYEEYKKGRK